MLKNAPSLAIFAQCHALGIDVSKAHLDIVGLTHEADWHCQIPNTEPAIEAMALVLQQGGYQGKLICESTGHYHLLLAVTLGRHGLDLRILNPLQSHKHQQARIRKTKTDALDARVLATMALTEPDLPKARVLEPEAVLIRLKQGQLHSLDKQLQRMTRSLAAYTETYSQLGLDAGDNQIRLTALVTELRHLHHQLQKELDTLLKKATAPQEQASLEQIPGFSPMVAGLVGSVFDRQAASAKAWIAFAGLDVSVRQSGTWKGRGKLTKRGNRYLRKRLYSAAWGAMMNDEVVRRYYDHLKARGRKHVEALCIIARKLLNIAYAVLIKGKTYDPNIAFALPKT